MNLKTIMFLVLFSAYSLFSCFVYTKGTNIPPTPVANEQEVVRGKLLFQKHNCIACHQIYGLGGYLGPELTNEISQPGKGKGYAQAIITSGLNKMPNLHLEVNEINALLAYLEYIDNCSKSNSKN